MTQRSLHWNGATIGDADALVENATDGIGYRLGNTLYESPFVDIGLRMLLNGDGNRGVLNGWLNELAVTGIATPVAVDTGGAIIYGMPYENTVAINVVVPSPTTDTRYDRIVLRRDWAAQTIRITRIAGVEGGGIPAMTQSPAPSGSGIYDMPLATLSITTGGVIAVTDAREYCQFGTVPAANSIGTTQIANNAVDWADRAIRTCRKWIAGGDLHPTTAAGQFSYYDTTPTWTSIIWTGASTWDGGATTQGWQLTGSRYEGAYSSFSLPANYASGNLTLYVWWAANAAVASTFALRTAVVSFMSNGANDNGGLVQEYSSQTISLTPVANNWYRTAGAMIRPTYLSSCDDLTLICVVWWDNTAVGAEDINILGLELEYTGYV